MVACLEEEVWQLLVTNEESIKRQMLNLSLPWITTSRTGSPASGQDATGGSAGR
jgi:hypothetical protein